MVRETRETNPWPLINGPFVVASKPMSNYQKSGMTELFAWLLAADRSLETRAGKTGVRIVRPLVILVLIFGFSVWIMAPAIRARCCVFGK